MEGENSRVFTVDLWRAWAYLNHALVRIAAGMPSPEEEIMSGDFVE
jgi:hypothetical protein